MKNTLLALSLLAGIATASGEKKVLDHTDFDRWEKVTNNSISNNGVWASYVVNPQEGDGTLYFYNTAKGNKIEIRRGYHPAFTADGNWAFALIRPLYEETRSAKIAKKKDFDLPQDSLAIIKWESRKPPFSPYRSAPARSHLFPIKKQGLPAPESASYVQIPSLPPHERSAHRYRKPDR